MVNDRCQRKRLADLCESIDYGFTTSAKKEPVGPKFLRITDIVGGGIDWSSVPFCEIDPAKKSNYRLHPGDIVIARTGATTGYSAYLSDVPDAVFASYLVRLRIRKPNSARFVAYYLKGPQFLNYMNGVLGDKSAQPNASATTLTQAPIDVPPPDIQRRIADVLGKLDDKIELNRRMNRTLEKMAAAIFKSWFIDFDPAHAKVEGRDPNLPAEIADLFPDSFEESPLGLIPKRWNIGHVSDLAAVTSGKRPQEHSKERTAEFRIPLYGGGGIMAYVATPMISEPFLLTGRVGTLGKIFRIVEPCWPSDNALMILPAKKEYLEFLFFTLQRFEFSSLNRGSTQPLLTQTDLKKLRLVIPPASLLYTFWRNVKAMFEKFDSNVSQSTVLVRMRDTLLLKLLSGEIELPDSEAVVEEVLS